MTKLVRLYLARRAQVRLAYRLDFAVNTLGDVLLAAVGLIMLGALFQQVRSLGGWSPPQVVFCWGFAEAAVGLFFVVFQGLWLVNQRYILGGDLDRVLLRPLDPYVQVLLDNVSIHDVPILLLGLAAMAAAVPWLPHIPAWRWCLAPILLGSATLVLGGVLTAVCSAGFHLHHRGTAIGLVFQLSTLTRYPIDLFAAPLRLLLTWVLPLGFAGFYPASFFIGSDAWTAWALATPAVGAASMALGYLAWRVGLGRYTSSGT